jgi:hypothetical protein
MKKRYRMLDILTGKMVEGVWSDEHPDTIPGQPTLFIDGKAVEPMFNSLYDILEEITEGGNHGKDDHA